MGEAVITKAIIDFSHQPERTFTDMHIITGLPIVGCAPSGYVPVSDVVITDSDIDEFLAMPTMGGKNWRERLHDSPIEVAHTLSNARVRCSVYETMGHDHQVRIAVRVLPLTVNDVDTLGLPRGIGQIALGSKGLFLITGPTGAGKTTTMAALLNQYNKTHAGHILTVEQPIEYIMKPVKSIMSQCEVGTNVPTFAEGVTHALRYNPDIIAIGEVLERDTAEAMLRAATSGHSVIATMHTRSCPDTVESLMQMFEGHDAAQKRALLSSVLRGVITQVLVPSVDGKRLLLAWELMIVDESIRPLIRDGKVMQLKSVMSGAAQKGMRLLNATLIDMVKKQQITIDAARRASYEESELGKIV